MAQQNAITLKVYGREQTGKGASIQLRLKDMVPGVVYGPQLKTPLNISLIPNEIIAAHKAAGKTTLVTLDAVDGAPAQLKGMKVLFKSIDAHPFKTRFVHVDFHAIDLTKKMRVVVPVHFVGKSLGQAEGGILNATLRELEIRCAPDQIPSSIDVDITNLNLNDSIHLSEVEKLFPNLEFIYENDYSLVTISEIREEKAAVVDPAAAAVAVAGAPAAGAPAAAAGAAGKAPAAAAGKAPAAAAPKAPAKK
ncbi:MAG: 50S ribosomal protein L25 [Bdellovibrionota bacterium]